MGDFWLIDSATFIINGKRTLSADYLRVEKKTYNENPHGEWNCTEVEVISRNGKSTHKVNGEIVKKAEAPDLNEGRILLQSEGAEIYFREVEITEL